MFIRRVKKSRVYVNDNNVLLFCRDVFPQGLPDEYAFVTTFKFRKTSRREDWYLWQVFDKYGIPQVGQPNVNSTKCDFYVSGFIQFQHQHQRRLTGYSDPFQIIGSESFLILIF